MIIMMTQYLLWALAQRRSREQPDLMELAVLCVELRRLLDVTVSLPATVLLLSTTELLPTVLYVSPAISL
jgi:hypothetical protein